MRRILLFTTSSTSTGENCPIINYALDTPESVLKTLSLSTFTDAWVDQSNLDKPSFRTSSLVWLTRNAMQSKCNLFMFHGDHRNGKRRSFAMPKGVRKLDKFKTENFSVMTFGIQNSTERIAITRSMRSTLAFGSSPKPATEQRLRIDAVLRTWMGALASVVVNETPAYLGASASTQVTRVSDAMYDLATPISSGAQRVPDHAGYQYQLGTCL